MMLCALTAAAAFSAAEALGLMHAVGLAFYIVALCFFALYVWTVPKRARKGAAVLFAVAVLGALIQIIWSAPVAAFFAAVSAFGCMVALEKEKDDSGSVMSDRFRSSAMIAAGLTFLTAIVMNGVLLLNLTRTQADEIGRIQLNVIRSELQDTLASAEANLLHAAIRAEQLIDADASREALDHFIHDQRDGLLADESFMNIYIAGSDWHVVPEFDAPPDFHASERVWYIGAADHPGKVYITEPYKDINTGNMCFTISTMLSDGETVVAMDLNFSKVQQSIREMTEDEEKAAMIADTGIGMDKAFIAKLFDAFSQEDATTTNKYGGSGLGMAITKRMVDMMGGEIMVESEKGVGSTFTVTIPLGQAVVEEAAKAADETAPAASASVAGLHVLIAEDQEMNAEVLADLLEMEEMSSEWARNGQIAVEMFAKSEINHFDAVLMDMRMPVMDGLTATREIRKLDRPDAKTVPIVALTANAFEEEVQQCLQAGMNAHLSKPVDIDVLKSTLGKMIAK